MNRSGCKGKQTGIIVKNYTNKSCLAIEVTIPANVLIDGTLGKCKDLERESQNI